VLLLGVQPTFFLLHRNLSSIALAKYAYANQCSPLSLLQCPPLRPDDRTEAVLDTAVVINPNDSEARRNRALYFILQGRFDQADRELRQVVAQSPRDSSAIFALSTLDLRAGRDTDAVAIWRRLRATSFVGSYADVAMQGRDFAGARSLNALAVQANPADPVLRAHLTEAENALARAK
jgi:predicted Zn-dependent protease